MKDEVRLKFTGHVLIKDDLGNVLLDECNAVHQQNAARVFARALSNESNYVINSLAFGNGGTTTNAAGVILYKTPNTGVPPDPNTWNSRLYHETFRLIVNAEGWPTTPSSGPGTPPLSPLLGTDPGSADANTGVRPGGGAVPGDDPPTVVHVSGPGVNSVENGLISSAVVVCVINAAEPTGEYLTDVLGQQPSNTTFSFDEMGLYTTGLQPIASGGYQEVGVGDVSATSITNLLPNKTYSFGIMIDGGATQIITFTTPANGGSGAGGAILYGDVVVALLTGPSTWNPSWTVGTSFIGSTGSVTVGNDGTFSPSLAANSLAYGYLIFTSNSTGSTSSIILSPYVFNPSDNGTMAHPYQLFSPVNGLNAPYGATLLASVSGAQAGVQNDPTNSYLECERLLTHLIFSPVLKAANRTLVITYTIAISVAATPPVTM
jgi:hypothetical protein